MPINRSPPDLGHPHKVIAALANYLILGRCQKVICFSSLPWITEDLCKILMQRHSNKKVSSIYARNTCTLASESLTWNISAFLNELHGCPQHMVSKILRASMELNDYWSSVNISPTYQCCYPPSYNKWLIQYVLFRVDRNLCNPWKLCLGDCSSFVGKPTDLVHYSIKATETVYSFKKLLSHLSGEMYAEDATGK